jgi:hypothetical protein
VTTGEIPTKVPWNMFCHYGLCGGHPSQHKEVVVQMACFSECRFEEILQVGLAESGEQRAEGFSRRGEVTS